MALVKAKRDELLGPLSAVSGIIERRHTLPILSNVLIERGTQALLFLATDIEIPKPQHACITRRIQGSDLYRQDVVDAQQPGNVDVGRTIANLGRRAALHNPPLV